MRKWWRKKSNVVAESLICYFCSRIGNANQANPLIHVFETLGFNDEYGFDFGKNSWFHKECYEMVRSADNFKDLNFVIQNRVKSITAGIEEGKKRKANNIKCKIKNEAERDAWDKIKKTL